MSNTGDICGIICSICCVCCAPGMTNFCLMKSGTGNCCSKKINDDEFEAEEARIEARLHMQEATRAEREGEAAAGKENGRRSSVDRQPGPRDTMRAEIRQDS